MGKRLILLMLSFSLSFLIGCASVEERFSFINPAKEILSNNRFVVVPSSVIHEYVPCDSDIDGYLKGDQEIWQKEIGTHLLKQFTEKGIKSGVELLNPSEFKKKLEASLAKNGRKGFMNPNTGTFDEDFYKDVMSDLAGQYKAPLIVPRLILKTASFSSAGIMRFSAKAKWDGVSRTVETGGSAFGRFMAAGLGGERHVSGNAPVYSLHVEIYNSKGMAFWSNGGFDVKEKVSAGFVGTADLVKRENIAELFGEKNKDNMKECIEVAFEPLLSE